MVDVAANSSRIGCPPNLLVVFAFPLTYQPIPQDSRKAVGQLTSNMSAGLTKGNPKIGGFPFGCPFNQPQNRHPQQQKRNDTPGNCLIQTPRFWASRRGGLRLLEEALLEQDDGDHRHESHTSPAEGGGRGRGAIQGDMLTCIMLQQPRCL